MNRGFILNELRYKRTCKNIAIAVLLNTVLLQILGYGAYGLFALLNQPLRSLARVISWNAADLCYAVKEILILAAYLVSFMLPAFIFMYKMRNDNRQPMRFEVVLEPEIPLVIIAAIGLILPAAYINSFIVSFIDFSSVFASEPLDTPVKVLMAFISVAIVPALCEEFLYRGCILSNLLPYGKATAIIASAILFSMMHGNVAQFFYTFVAGLVLGAVYVETGSIWPCTFIHLFNNFYSVIQQVIYERGGESAEINIVIFIMEIMIPAAGLAIGAWLIYLRLKNGKRTEGAQPTKVYEIERKRILKGFINPVMIAHIVVTLLIAGTTVLIALGS